MKRGLAGGSTNETSLVPSSLTCSFRRDREAAAAHAGPGSTGEGLSLIRLLETMNFPQHKASEISGVLLH